MQKKSFNLDQLTLEYFTNKTTYKKYLAKKDPENTRLHINDSIKGNEDILMKLFSQMLQDPTSKDFLTLYPSFEPYVLNALEYLDKHKHVIETETDSIEGNVSDSNSFNDNAKEVDKLDYDNSIKESNKIEFWKSENVHKLL